MWDFAKHVELIGDRRLQDKLSTYAGPMDVVRKVVQKEGVLGLYAGMEATFWRCVTICALSNPVERYDDIRIDTSGGTAVTSGVSFKCGRYSRSQRFVCDA